MKALCTCAALAVVTAIAHGSFADAIAQGKNTLPPFRTTASALDKIETEGDKHCTEEINAFRKEVDSSAKPYKPNGSGAPTTDLGSFFTDNDCDAIKNGTFTHIYDVTGTKVLLFSASQPAVRTKMTCSEAVQQWRKGFETFAGKYPEEFQQNTGPYTDTNAVSLVSVMNESEQLVYCGNPKGCDEGIVLCYIKPSPFQENARPVTAQMWHKVQESYKLKPKLEAHSDGNQACLNAVNAIRDAEGLKLEKFTAAANDRGKQSRTPSTPYEDALYNVTCAQIEDGSIDPKVEETYTLIYAVKEGQQPPTATEAVDIWKSGYEQLGPDTPPAFKAKGEHIRAAAAASEIYYDNTVAGFVSLMVDGTREIRCYNATGCKKAALICFLSKPTLVENTPPISEGTWKKILALDNEANGNGAGDTIKFTLRSEADNCLTEINEVRSQDSLGLSSFVAKAQTSTGAAPEDVAPTESVELAKAFTCDVIKAGNAPILFSNNKRSVMYYSGSSATCSNAITEWKKGYDKFKDLTIPPTYTSSEDIYKTGAATNFISLVSEGDETVVRCYTVEKCSEEGLLCVLEPAVFEDGTAPITEATWQKVTSTFSNGVSGTSVYGALLSSVLVAVGLFALNF